MFQRSKQNSIAPYIIRKRDYDTVSSSRTSISSQDNGENDNITSNEIIYVKTISTSNITLSAEQTINNHTTSNELVLVNGQTSSVNNGIYLSNSSSWTRIDTNLNDIAIIKVIDGYFEGSYWQMETRGVEVGTDNINFIPLMTSVNAYEEQSNPNNFHLATENFQYLINPVGTANFNNIDYSFAGDIVQKDSNGNLQNYGTIKRIKRTITSTELQNLNTSPVEIIPPLANCVPIIIGSPVYRYNYIAGTYNDFQTYLRYNDGTSIENLYELHNNVGAQTTSFNDVFVPVSRSATLTDLFVNPNIELEASTNWVSIGGTSTLDIIINYKYEYML